MSDAVPTPSGLLLIDKDRGPTSMRVCADIRRRLRLAGAPKRVKVGHAGTLDPLATGLLVVMVGRATRLCDALMAGEKAYDAEIDLSARTPTDDAEGAREEFPVDTPPTRAQVEAALAAFVGTISQTPPAYSAVHVGGRRAYALARDGRAPVLEPRTVVIHALRLTAFDWPLARVEIDCAKGVYIRSLARDLGTALATGGMLASLRRTRVGAFRIHDAVRLADLPEVLEQRHLLPWEHLKPAGSPPA